MELFTDNMTFGLLFVFKECGILVSPELECDYIITNSHWVLLGSTLSL